MDTLIIMVSIMTLMLLSTTGPARATTLLVSNELKTRGNVPVFVTCDPPRGLLSKSVPLGQKSLIEIPATAGNDEISLGYRMRPMICVGTFYAEAHFSRSERPYVLYDSDKDATKCKYSLCFVLVKDDGFYRWNYDKKIWDKIVPITWF